MKLKDVVASQQENLNEVVAKLQEAQKEVRGNIEISL
jgi:hypothetical protein